MLRDQLYSLSSGIPLRVMLETNLTRCPVLTGLSYICRYYITLIFS